MSSGKQWVRSCGLLLVFALLLTACGGAPATSESSSLGAVEQTASAAAEPASVPATVAETSAAAEASAPASEAPAEASAPASQAPAKTQASGSGELRKLQGQLRVVIQGALPVEGAPATRTQTTWQTVLDKYRELQPGVELEVIDVPARQNGEQFCEALKSAKQMPDVSLINECNYFRPTPQEIADGTNIAVDFKAFEDEINPYTGQPWKDDWINDAIRTGRCTEGGAVDTWTCQTVMVEASGIWVNMDILKEYGYDDMPATLGELWELSAKINADGKYAAWDSSAGSAQGYARNVFSLVAMDRFEAAGGDRDNIIGWTQNPKLGAIGTTEALCSGVFTISNNPSNQEGLQQVKRYVDATPGGAAAFYDPARDQTGQLWLTGQAAFRLSGNWELANVLQAQDDGTFAVENWAPRNFPTLTKDDLVNKDIEIAYDGEFFSNLGGAGDVFAPTPNVRESGEDANVDLMVRDFLQFLSSPTGQQRTVDIGRGVPTNPALFEELNNPQLENWLTIQPKRYAGVTQPPASFTNPLFREQTKSIEAWMQGIIDFETASKQADENAIAERVKQLEDQLASSGGELPEACKPYATR